VVGRAPDSHRRPVGVDGGRGLGNKFLLLSEASTLRLNCAVTREHRAKRLLSIFFEVRVATVGEMKLEKGGGVPFVYERTLSGDFYISVCSYLGRKLGGGKRKNREVRKDF